MSLRACPDLASVISTGYSGRRDIARPRPRPGAQEGERRPPEPGFTAPLEALLERGREGGEIRTDVPLATLVESLLVLVGACVRTGKAAGMGVEDMSSTALRLFLTGARLAAD